MNKTLSISLLAAIASASATLQAADVSPKSVVSHYADLAEVMYQDSLTTAKNLETAIDALAAAPSEATLNLAKAAWKASRVPYQQTEAYRFGNAIVDDWEGKVNAWPLDEGLIDYVSKDYGTESDENALYAANIIANPVLKYSGKTIDATNITPALLSDTLQEADGVESNVATGYHAIEFLLWGQDTNGNGAGAGARPATDFSTTNCTGGNCDRRIAYLQAAAELLVSDVQWIADQWKEGGDARKAVESDPSKGLSAIFTGMGSLSYGELAGERMKLGLMLHDPEEEHDCFSDNTHYSHYLDAMSVKNVFTGAYTRIDGTQFTGPSASDLLAASSPKLNTALLAALDTTLDKMQVLVDSAEVDGVAYDQLIAEGNKEGNAKVQAAVDALVAQTQDIERAVAALKINKIEFEGSDSLDNPNAVFE